MAFTKKQVVTLAEKTIKFILYVLTEPIVFVSLLAPTFIRFTLETLSEAAANTGHVTQPLLSNFAFPGVTDFIMQYYAACIAFVLWVFKAGRILLIPLIQDQRNGELLTDYRWKQSDLSRLIYTLISVVVLLLGILVLTGNGTARLDLLDIYVGHIEKLGDWKFPPFTSYITWFRGGIGILGIWLVLATNSGAIQSQEDSGTC